MLSKRISIGCLDCRLHPSMTRRWLPWRTSGWTRKECTRFLSERDTAGELKRIIRVPLLANLTLVLGTLPITGVASPPSPAGVTITPNNPNQTALSLGHTISYNVQVSVPNGFNGTVALTASGLPAGVTASFSPASVTTSTVGSATLILTSAYSNETFIGSSTITVTAAGGGISEAVTFQVTTRPLQYRGTCGVQ